MSAAEPAGPAASAPASARPDGRAYLWLVLAGAGIGVPAAALGAVFLALAHQVTVWLWTDLPRALGADAVPWYLVVGLPITGAAVVWGARRFLPGDGGHSPLDGLGSGPTPWQHAPGIALAALGTLAFGGVLGPEAPLIGLGSAVGVAAVHVLRLGPRAAHVLGTAGSFSAISAPFGGPLVAGMLLLESGVGLGAGLIPALLPGLVAAAVGYVLFVGLGDWGGLDHAGLTIGSLPPYDGTHVTDLLLAIGVGLVAAVVLALVHRLATAVAALIPTGRPGRRALWVLLGGGAAVGLVAEVSELLGGEVDQVLFSGQAAIADIVERDSLAILTLALVAKAICYAICLGCGFRGGPVFPGVFLGIALATCAATVFGVSPTWAVAVGTAAGVTAGTGLLFSSLLFAMLLVGTGGLDAVPAAVLASASAWLVRGALARRGAAVE